MPGGKKGRIVRPWKRTRGLAIGESQKAHIARKVYCKHHGLPKIPSGHVVHHIDENKDNNSINNLKLITRGEHMKIHPQALGKGKHGLIWVGNESNYARERKAQEKKKWLEQEITEEQRNVLLNLEKQGV